MRLEGECRNRRTVWVTGPTSSPGVFVCSEPTPLRCLSLISQTPTTRLLHVPRSTDSLRRATPPSLATQTERLKQNRSSSKIPSHVMSMESSLLRCRSVSITFEQSSGPRRVSSSDTHTLPPSPIRCRPSTLKGSQKQSHTSAHQGELTSLSSVDRSIMNQGPLDSMPSVPPRIEHKLQYPTHVFYTPRSPVMVDISPE